MRIHELEIQNIASLKGKHHINFDYIGEQSSLFAITGKTGAGKSSILNSISLALYGDVYKKDSQNNDFVTLGESFGEINLTFSVGTQFYKAHWHMKLKKNNGEYLKKPQLVRTLFMKKAGSFEAIEKDISDILHLNFNQFCKTSILNQGEFARFLTSSFNERKLILEKFYDGMNLELINLKLREKIKSNREYLEEKHNLILGIKQAIKDIQISKEDIDAQNTNTSQLKNINHLLVKISPYLNDLQKQYQLIGDNHNRKQELLSKQQIAQKEYNRLKQLNDALTTEFNLRDKILKERKPVLDECLKKQFHFDQNQTQKTHYLDQKQSYLNEKANAAGKLVELSNLLISKKQELAELSEKNPILENLNSNQLSSELVALSGYQDKIRDLTQRQERNHIKQTQQIEKIEQILIKQRELDDQLRSKNAEQLEQEIQKLNLRVNELTRLKSTISENIQEAQKIKESSARVENSLTKLNTQTIDHNSKLKHIHDQIRLQENTIQLYSLQLSIKQCLEHSLDKGSCVVCGQDIRNLHLTKLTIEEAELNLAQAEREKLQITLGELSALEQQLKVETLGFKSEQNRLKNQLSEINSQSLILWNQFSELPLSQNILKADSITPVQALIDKASGKITKLNEQKTKYHLDQQSLNSLKDRLVEYQAVLEEIKQENSALASELILAKSGLQKIISLYSLDQTNEGISIKAQLEQLLKDCELFEGLKLNISEIEKDKLRQTEIQMNADVKANQLSKHIDQLIASNIELERFIKENANPDILPVKELEKIQQEYERANIELMDNKERLNQEKVFMAEAKSKLESYEDQIKGATIIIKGHQKDLASSMDNQSKANCLNKEQFHTIPSLIDKFIALDIQDLKLATIIQASLEQFNDLLTRSKVLYEQADRDLTKNRTLFEQKLDGEKQIALIESEADILTQEKVRLDNLNELLGKDEFRNYILSIIETTLIEQTNKELAELCNGRYSLCQSNKTNRLITEFKIIDHYADGMVRKISTLSGGETFLVSLAMALALAELTRGQTQLDSLFIDEGFGTLDHETIDEVYELLLNIQHSGKQIGIISHVRDLTARIPININLEKNMSGASQIQIINN